MEGSNNHIQNTKTGFYEFVRSDGTVELRSRKYDELVSNIEIKNAEIQASNTEFIQPDAADDLRWLRSERDRKLIECDWTQGADVPDNIKLAWQPYRQSLRDITNTYSNMLDVVWPEKPE